MYRVPALAAQEPKLRTTLKCAQDVRCLAISPDCKTLAAGMSDGTARLWDLVTDKPFAVLKEGDWPVTALAFGKDGKTLAQGTGVALAGDPNDYLTLWDIPRQKKARTFLKAERGVSGLAGVSSLAFSKDGTLLVAATGGGILVWDVTKKEKPRVLTAKGYAAEFVSVATNSDGKTVVAAHGRKDLPGDPAVLVWDVPSGKSTVFKELKGEQFAVAISPDGKSAAATGAEGVWVHVLDLVNRKIRPLKGADDSATFSVAFSPDGKVVAAGTGNPDDSGKESAVLLWDLASGKTIATLHGHKGIVQSLAFGGDGSILATAGADRRIRLWNIKKKP